MNALAGFLDGHLIAAWRKALRLRIIQLHTGITVLAAAIYNLAKAYPTMAQDVLSRLPPTLLHPAAVNTALVVWLVIGAYARLVPQPAIVLPPTPPPGA